MHCVQHQNQLYFQLWSQIDLNVFYPTQIKNICIFTTQKRCIYYTITQSVSNSCKCHTSLYMPEPVCSICTPMNLTVHCVFQKFRCVTQKVTTLKCLRRKWPKLKCLWHKSPNYTAGWWQFWGGQNARKIHESCIKLWHRILPHESE